MMQKNHKHMEHMDHMNHEQHKHHENHEHHHEHNHDEIKSKWYWLKVFLLLAPYAYFIVLSASANAGAEWTQTWAKYTWHWGIWFTLTTYIVFWEGRRYLKIYKRFFVQRIADMDTLIGLAAHILYLYSFIQAMMNLNGEMYSYDQMWEGTAVLFVATNIGHSLEATLKKNATKSYDELNNLRNSNAIKLVNGKNVSTPIKELKIGDLIVVKRGEMIPIDGILQNNGIFDYSNITGESKKLELQKGKEVFSGSYNLKDAITLKVSKLAKESTISQIVDKIEDATMNKPDLQRIADKLLKWFIPFVLSTAILTFVAWMIIGGTTDFVFPWLSSEDSYVSNAIKAGVTVIAIACPCSLGIAVPMVNLVTVYHSSHNGMMLNNPASLEEVRHVKYIAFDKTGTITNENLSVDKVVGDESLIGVAKGLEKDIKHPIASAILAMEGKEEKITSIKHIKNGVEGTWKKQKVEMKTLNEKDIDSSIDKSKTLIGLYIDNKLKTTFLLSNEIKKGVKKTIRKLHRKGYKTIMITGDSKGVAEYVANKVGIDKVFASAKPEDKSKIIKDLQKDGKVLFIGDGFNDSIAIKQANVSIAFATGSNITNDIADISIANNKFNSIYKLIVISNLNNRFIKMSLTWAVSFNAITIPVAFLLLVQPWLGALIMATSDIFIVIGALIYKAVGNRKLKGINDNI